MKVNELIRKAVVSVASAKRAGKTSLSIRTSTAKRTTATLSFIPQPKFRLVVCRYIGKMLS